MQTTEYIYRYVVAIFFVVTTQTKEKYICIHPQLIKLLYIDPKDPSFIPEVTDLVKAKDLQIVTTAEEKLGEAIKQVNEYLSGGDDVDKCIESAQENQAAAAKAIEEATKILDDESRTKILNDFKEKYEEKFKTRGFPMDHTLKQMQTEVSNCYFFYF